MKRALVIAAAILGSIPLAFGAVITDSFDGPGHVPGEAPDGWDQTWMTNTTPVQVGLMTVESGVGRDGSQGISLDVGNALQNYLIVNTNGVSGSKLVLSADFQIAITAEDLDAAPANLNSALIGLAVKTSPLWWEGPNSITTFCRRAPGNANVGLRIPQNPWVYGSYGNATIGLPAAGLEAATSTWFTITMVLEDNGVNWTWTSSLKNEDGVELGPPSPAQTLDAVQFPPGATLYGAIGVGHAETGVTNDTKGAVSKVDMVSVDNFSFGAGSLGIADISVGGVDGHTFTSVDGRTHALQYSTDEGATYSDAGITIVGDGTAQTLVDPAVDTAGRIYRVVTKPENFVTFDWEEFAGIWWQDGYGISETQDGFTLQAAGRASANDGGDGAGGSNGYGFKAAYTQDTASATYTINVAGETQEFAVVSIDIKGDIGNAAMPSGDLAVKGMLQGVEQWSIDPAEDNAFHTYTSASTGDLFALIDEVVWTAPYDETDAQLVWNNQIDNLTVALDPTETVSSSSETLDDAVVIEAAAFEIEGNLTVHANSNLATGEWVQASAAVVSSGMPAARYVVTHPGSDVASFRLGEPIIRTIFFDSFEAADNWTATVNDPFDLTRWEYGTPNHAGAVTIVGANSGTKCYGTDLDAGYRDDIDITLTSPVIDLAGVTSADLEWFERKDIDDSPALGDDNGYVRIIDLDAGSTTLVHTSQGPNAVWEKVSVPIPASALGHRIQISFQFVEEGQDSFGDWSGWYIDDVLVK